MPTLLLLPLVLRSASVTAARRGDACAPREDAAPTEQRIMSLVFVKICFFFFFFLSFRSKKWKRVSTTPFSFLFIAARVVRRQKQKKRDE